MPPDRLERLTNLVLVLLDARTPLTLTAIVHRVPGYPPDPESARQVFERDKRILRDEGIPVRTESLDGGPQTGYRIDPGEFYLPDMDLAPDEQAALQLAVAGVHLGDPSGHDALAKLGATGIGGGAPLASFEPPPALVPLFDALRRRAEVSFDYRGTRRTLSPAGLWFRHGHWYLVGWDAARDAGRTFRVDRIGGLPTVGAAASAQLPPGFDAAAAVPDGPWQPRPDDDAEDAVVVRVDEVEGPRVAAEVGEAAVAARHDGGAVTVRLGVASRPAMRSWVLGLGHHAEVLATEDFRAEVLSWLRAVRDAPPAPPAPPAATATAGGGGPARSGTNRRLQRLLAVVGWLARVGEAPIDEVARRFGMDEDELVRELELAACCGLPPYSPDVLMEIVVTDRTVQTFLPRELARPRRLTPAEGFAVAASARTILAVPGAERDGALARALAKLEAALGDAPQLVVDLPEPALLGVVRDAAEQGTRLRIEYHSASSDDVTERQVDPQRVLAAGGHWYLVAHCHRAGEVRRFRVDRIRSAEPLGPVPGGPASPAPADDGFVPGPGALRVTLVVGPGARWAFEDVPADRRTPLEGGGEELVLAVGGVAWLERLLLQAGTEAAVVAPPELTGVASDAAARVLAVYGIDREGGRDTVP